MVKTHRNSRFVLRTIAGIRDCCDVILQVEKTESIDRSTNQPLYLCEVVTSNEYRQDGTLASLSAELIKANDDNRRLRRKNDALQAQIRKMEVAPNESNRNSPQG